VATGLTPLSQSGPPPGDAAGGGAVARPRHGLTQRQKAAIIVRLLLSEGAQLPLDSLSEEAQADLTAQMADMRLVDRDTLRAVVEEFVAELEAIGLSFPGGIEGALGMLDGHISPATAARLRREAGVAARGDPWARISGLGPDRLLKVLEEESVEVGAVLLSKINVRTAAELLGQIPGDRARRLAYAISKTGSVDPDTVRRIGLSLAAQLDAEPVRAFPEGPVQRIGAILNSSRAATRDDVLEGLEETDSDFAAEVRRAIFTFANIPDRVAPRDVPRVLRGLDQGVLVSALAHAEGDPAMARARDFILDNTSKRMADGLREEIAEASVSAAAGEEATNAVIAEIRRLSDAGDLILLADEG
jgi:flagellar motor switch protein FliG